MFGFFQLRNIGEKIRRFVFGKFVKTCRDLYNRFQTEGFFNPICVLDKDGLGMKIPDKSFGIGEVRSAVGSRRLLDVMNVNSKFFLFFLVKTQSAVLDSVI